MLVRQLWRIRSHSDNERGEKPCARIGLGGTLKTTTEKGRRLGRRLGWGSFFAMAVVVAFAWVRWALMAFGLDSSNGFAGLEVTMLSLAALAVIVSHLLIFVCDFLTGGDAKPSVWALVLFWGGMLVGPLLQGGIGMLL